MKEIAVIVFFLLASFVFSFSAPSENKDVANLQIQKENVIENGVIENSEIEEFNGVREYVVNGNDNLWTISKRVYGVGHKWNIIYQANIDKIRNPDVLIPGIELIVPDKNTKLKINIEVAPPGYVYVKTVNAHLTGYCPCGRCCGNHANGRTSINKNAWIMNGCAADSMAISYGWMVYIPGKGYRKVDDTGGAMRRSWKRGIYHVDVRFASHYEAMGFNKWTKIKIYKPID